MVGFVIEAIDVYIWFPEKGITWIKDKFHLKRLWLAIYSRDEQFLCNLNFYLKFEFLLESWDEGGLKGSELGLIRRLNFGWIAPPLWGIGYSFNAKCVANAMHKFYLLEIIIFAIKMQNSHQPIMATVTVNFKRIQQRDWKAGKSGTRSHISNYLIMKSNTNYQVGQF